MFRSRAPRAAAEQCDSVPSVSCDRRRERMPRRQRDHHFLFEQRSHREPDHVRDRRANERGIDLLVVQPLHQLAAAAFFEYQRDQRRQFRGTRESRAARTDERARSW